MNAEEIIRFIHDAKKTTPVKAYVKAKPGIEFPVAAHLAQEIAWYLGSGQT